MKAETISAGVAGIALILSVGNFFHTNRVAEKLRQRQFRLDQWSLLREEIGSGVKNFEETASEMLSIDVDHTDLEECKNRFRDMNRNLNRSHLLLMQALNNASHTSGLSPEIAWVELGYQPKSSGDTNIDQIGIIANSINICVEKDDFSMLLKSILDIAFATGNGIRSAVREQTNLFDPNFHKGL